MSGDLFEHRFKLARGGDIVADLCQGSHFLRAALGLGMKLGGMDGGACVGGDGVQETQVVIVENTLLGGALHAQHADGLAP